MYNISGLVREKGSRAILPPKPCKGSYRTKNTNEKVLQ
jgi:hypothetical protein